MIDFHLAKGHYLNESKKNLRKHIEMSECSELRKKTDVI